MQLLWQLGAQRLGVGWGYLIGQIVNWLEQNPQTDSPRHGYLPRWSATASIPARNYQSNENIRLMAQQLGRGAAFPLSPPALPESLEEREVRSVDRGLPPDIPPVGNAGHRPREHRRLPLQPRLRLPCALAGSLLQEQRACGRMLVYYFNEDGHVIQSEQDFAIQIPVDVLRRCQNIIGVCSANTSAKAVRGALRIRAPDPHRGAFGYHRGSI